MDEKVKVSFEVSKSYLRSVMIALGFIQADPEKSVKLIEEIGDEILIDYNELQDSKAEAEQANFVVAVAAIGMAAHRMDAKEKQEKAAKDSK